MRLDEFEVAMQEVLNATEAINLKNKGDPIPAEIRAEFNLPKEMKIGQKEFKIDFDAVRRQDASVKKSVFTWSG
jgi:hypothetical protein